MGLKVMPRSQKGHKFILCVIDEVANYSPHISFKVRRDREALIENVISKYCITDYKIMDQNSAFISTLMNYLFRKFGIKVKTVAPYKHQSSQSRAWNQVFV